MSERRINRHAGIEILEGRLHLHAGHDHGEGLGSVTIGRVPWGMPAMSVSQAPVVSAVTTDIGPGETAGVSDVSPAAAAAVPAPVRIDAAGGGFTDAGGRTWLSDRFVAGGSVTTAAYAVGGTVDDALYYPAGGASSTTPSPSPTARTR